MTSLNPAETGDSSSQDTTSAADLSSQDASNPSMNDAPVASADSGVDAASADSASANAAAAGEPAIDPNDPLAVLRQAKKDRKNVQAKVIRWQRNGLEVELEDGTRAFMPNDMIDRDPNRNVANYFGKTIPVRITSIKGATPSDAAKKPEIVVSHRTYLEDEMRQQGKEALANLNVGDVVDAKIKSFSKEGAIVDLGAGIDAIIRSRDLSWQQFDHPYEVVKRGDTVQAKILQIDKGRRKVWLGVRQLTPDPFIEKFAQFKPDEIVRATVRKIVEMGAELELENGIVAFLPISEISWQRIENVREAINEGDSVEIKLLTVDQEKRRITGSMKQLVENPMRKIEATFKVGSDHNGIIKEVNRGGVVVSLEHGAEGFVPRRELSHDRIERLEDTFKEGKALDGLRVIEYDRRNGRITLSLIEAEKVAQRESMKNYRATSKESSFSLGDLASLKEKLEKLERGG